MPVSVKPFDVRVDVNEARRMAERKRASGIAAAQLRGYRARQIAGDSSRRGNGARQGLAGRAGCVLTAEQVVRIGANAFAVRTREVFSRALEQDEHGGRRRASGVPVIRQAEPVRDGSADQVHSCLEIGVAIDPLRILFDREPSICVGSGKGPARCPVLPAKAKRQPSKRAGALPAIQGFPQSHSPCGKSMLYRTLCVIRADTA
ncbi:hypothetical protein ACMZ4X_01675 [Achromobacter marplatensis]